MIQPPEIDELKDIPVNVSAALTSRIFNQVNIPTYARSKIKSNNDVAGAVSAIVSTLPGVDLRFMKIRRNQKMEKKVVVSFYQERMLREIFTELDFIKCGIISCKELRKASNYVEMRMANMSTAEGIFKNLKREFLKALKLKDSAAMNYNQFAIAMTGSKKSLLECATENEMNMMTFLYVEYAQMQKRNQTVDALHLEPTATNDTKIYAIPRKTACSSPAKPLPFGYSDRSERGGLVDLMDSSLDAERYKSFAVLFGLNAKQNKSDHDSSNEKKYLASLDPVNVSFEYRLALRNDQEAAPPGHNSSMITSSASRKGRKGPSIWDGQMDLCSPLSSALGVPAALRRDEALLEQLVGFDISTPSHAEHEEEERGKNLSSFRDFAPFRDLNKRSRTASPSTSSLQESLTVATSGLVPSKSVSRRGPTGPPQSYSTRSQSSLPDAYSLGLFGLISSADATIANIPDTTFSSQQEEYEAIERRIRKNRKLGTMVLQSDEGLMEEQRQLEEEKRFYASVLKRTRNATSTLKNVPTLPGKCYGTSQISNASLVDSVKFSHLIRNKAHKDVRTHRSESDPLCVTDLFANKQRVQSAKELNVPKSWSALCGATSSSTSSSSSGVGQDRGNISHTHTHGQWHSKGHGNSVNQRLSWSKESSLSPSISQPYRPSAGVDCDRLKFFQSDDKSVRMGIRKRISSGG